VKRGPMLVRRSVKIPDMGCSTMGQAQEPKHPVAKLLPVLRA